MQGRSRAASLNPVGAENHVTLSDLSSHQWTGAVSSTFCCADTSHPGAVGDRDPPLRLAGSAAPTRLDGPARAVRSGQRRRDLGPAPPDRRAPAPRQDTQAVLGRPRDPIRLAQPIPSRQRSQLRLIASWRTLLRWHADIANAAGVTPTTEHRSTEDKSSAASLASTASPHDNQAIENTHVTGPITYPSPTGW
jgi:hypothetical protein